LGHAEEHQFCLAHLIRDAQYAIDHGDTIFAPDFKALLKDACEVGRRRPDLAGATIATHRRRLERELERSLARKPTDAEGRKLRDAVYVDCSDKLFVFLKRRDAEPTDNESERALRPSVIFRKVRMGSARVGREDLRRPLLNCRNRPPQQLQRSYRHPRRPGTTRCPGSRATSPQGVSSCLLCLIPLSKGSRTNLTLAPERYSAIELLVRFFFNAKNLPVALRC
jgi:hypothetical protein